MTSTGLWGGEFGSWKFSNDLKSDVLDNGCEAHVRLMSVEEQGLGECLASELICYQ
jgi:hypothetical protein